MGKLRKLPVLNAPWQWGSIAVCLAVLCLSGAGIFGNLLEESLWCLLSGEEIPASYIQSDAAGHLRLFLMFGAPPVITALAHLMNVKGERKPLMLTLSYLFSGIWWGTNALVSLSNLLSKYGNGTADPSLPGFVKYLFTRGQMPPAVSWRPFGGAEYLIETVLFLLIGISFLSGAVCSLFGRRGAIGVKVSLALSFGTACLAVVYLWRAQQNTMYLLYLSGEKMGLEFLSSLCDLFLIALVCGGLLLYFLYQFVLWGLGDLIPVYQKEN